MARHLSKKQEMDIRALNVLTEKLESFEIESQDGAIVTYKLYPLQLGRLALITKRLIQLDLCLDNQDASNAVNRMWDICSSKPLEVAEIIAIATLRTKEDIDTKLKERTNDILWSPSMTPQGMTNILYSIIFQSFHQDFMKAIRLVKILSVHLSQTERESLIATEGTPYGGQ